MLLYGKGVKKGEKNNFICRIYNKEWVAVFYVKYASIGNVKMTVI